eukprot:symbB.v1.2.004212.t1/scaffold215.1/size331178/5
MDLFGASRVSSEQRIQRSHPYFASHSWQHLGQSRQCHDQGFQRLSVWAFCFLHVQFVQGRMAFTMAKRRGNFSRRCAMTSLEKFLQLPLRWSKDRAFEQDDAASEKPLGETRQRRLLMLENAAASGDAAWLEALLEAGVDLDAPNLFGQTPLFVAAWRGHAACVQMLLDAKAQILPDAAGSSCATAALAAEHHEVLQLLQRNGDIAMDTAAVETAVIDAKAVELPQNSWLFERSFDETFLSSLDALAASLPVPEMELSRRAAERLFFCREDVTRALKTLLEGQFDEVWVSPWLRFLRYRTAGMPLVPHVDYQWLPGYISAKLPGYAPTNHSTSHTLLLYLTDCYQGGKTQLLEGEGAKKPMASISCRRGRILLFPHEVLHEGTPVESLPKLMLRADVFIGSEKKRVFR